MWVNSADHFINPPELGTGEGSKAPKARPLRADPHQQSDTRTRHHTWAAVWHRFLAELLESSTRR
jgi:homoserine O-acetyltransferase